MCVGWIFMLRTFSKKKRKEKSYISFIQKVQEVEFRVKKKDPRLPLKSIQTTRSYWLWKLPFPHCWCLQLVLASSSLQEVLVFSSLLLLVWAKWFSISTSKRLTFLLWTLGTVNFVFMRLHFPKLYQLYKPAHDKPSSLKRCWNHNSSCLNTETTNNIYI